MKFPTFYENQNITTVYISEKHSPTFPLRL